MHAQTLVFVYNADSGWVNTLLDIGHKLVSPSSYACKLCTLTHTIFHERGEWTQFVAELGVPVEFLHRDELAERYGIRDAELPAVYRKSGNDLQLWMTRSEIDHCRSLAELERLVTERLRVG
jgi:hypothetical protein